jgi:uncharacterized membrane protein (UPF0127 family)
MKDNELSSFFKYQAGGALPYEWKPTELSKEDEQAFLKWHGEKPIPTDYDSRGFWWTEKELGRLKPTLADYYKEDPDFHAYSIGYDGRILKSPSHESFNLTQEEEDRLGGLIVWRKSDGRLVSVPTEEYNEVDYERTESNQPKLKQNHQEGGSLYQPTLGNIQNYYQQNQATMQPMEQQRYQAMEQGLANMGTIHSEIPEEQRVPTQMFLEDFSNASPEYLQKMMQHPWEQSGWSDFVKTQGIDPNIDASRFGKYSHLLRDEGSMPGTLAKFMGSALRRKGGKILQKGGTAPEEASPLFSDLPTMPLDIDGNTFTIYVAQDEDARTKGLSGLEQMGETEGMLFIFPSPKNHTMWMKDTNIPLDMLFMDSSGTIRNIIQGIPGSEELIGGGDDIKYVLELTAGTAAKNDIQPSDQIDIDEQYQKAVDDGLLKPMKILDEEGNVQMEIEGGERIFSRKFTSSIIEKIKKIQEVAPDTEEYEKAIIELGKSVAKEIITQDSREPEYTDEEETVLYSKDGSSVQKEEI